MENEKIRKTPRFIRLKDRGQTRSYGVSLTAEEHEELKGAALEKGIHLGPYLRLSGLYVASAGVGFDEGNMVAASEWHEKAVTAWLTEDPQPSKAELGRRFGVSRERVGQIIAEATSGQRVRHIDRERAMAAVHQAIKKGTLERGPCEHCGKLPEVIDGRQVVEAHHHLGYAEEHHLHVQWLCVEYHRSLPNGQEKVARIGH